MRNLRDFFLFSVLFKLYSKVHIFLVHIGVFRAFLIWVIALSVSRIKHSSIGSILLLQIWIKGPLMLCGKNAAGSKEKDICGCGFFY